MKKQILYISPVKAGKVTAVLYFVLSVPFLIFMTANFALSPAPKQDLSFLLVFFPCTQLVFLIGAFFAWSYNLVASSIGGIEYTSSTN